MSVSLTLNNSNQARGLYFLKWNQESKVTEINEFSATLGNLKEGVENSKGLATWLLLLLWIINN